MLQYIRFIDPININSVKSIANVAAFFKLDPELIDAEYKEFRLLLKDNSRINDFHAFWAYVETLKKDNGFLVPNIIALKNRILVLPLSSASCERGFSEINLNKTSTRNQLDSNTLNGIMRGKALLKMENKKCFNIDVAPLSHKMNVDMY